MAAQNAVLILHRLIAHRGMNLHRLNLGEPAEGARRTFGACQLCFLVIALSGVQRPKVAGHGQVHRWGLGDVCSERSQRAVEGRQSRSGIETPQKYSNGHHDHSIDVDNAPPGWMLHDVCQASRFFSSFLRGWLRLLLAVCPHVTKPVHALAQLAPRGCCFEICGRRGKKQKIGSVVPSHFEHQMLENPSNAPIL